METTEKKDRPGSPAWKSLLGRAVMSLDDDALSAYRKSRTDMEAKLARSMEERGLASLPYDFYMVQEVLVEYDRCGVLSEAVATCGGKESECVEAGKFDADIRLVWKFVQDGVRGRLKVVGGLDCGRTPAATLGQLMPNGKLVIQRDATTWNQRLNNGRGGLDRMDIIQFFDEKLLPVLVNFYNYPNCSLTLFADPAGKDYNEVVSMSAIQRLIRERGVDVVPCDKVLAMDSAVNDITNGNSPEIRIDCMRDALRRDNLLVGDACTMFCAAMAGKYHYEKLRSARGDSAERWSDRPDKNEWSHVADSGQYLSLAVFRGATDYSKPGGAQAAVTDYSYLGSGSDFGCI